MPQQALYLKWRPRGFEEVIGQGHVIQALQNALAQNRIRHAYLFNGPRGTGKTTMARILAKAVNCLHPDPRVRPCNECRNCIAINESRFLDLIEIDAASHNGVDDVRDLREKVAFSPSEGRYKVYIIDEVHRFSGAAFDALLKTLEEPPAHVLFVLATTELDKVPPTIKSRSLTFEFRRVSLREVADRLEAIVQAEGVSVERGALELVAQQGTGSVRDAISLLDQLISAPEEVITTELAARMLGTASGRAVSKIAQAIIENDAGAGLDAIHLALEEGADPSQFGRQIVEYLRNLLLVQTGGSDLVETSAEMRASLEQQCQLIPREALLRAVRAFNSALSEVRGGWQPQLPLELALIESTRPLPQVAAAYWPAPAQEAPPMTPRRAAPPPLPDSALPTPKKSKGSSQKISLNEARSAWDKIVQMVRQTPNEQVFYSRLQLIQVIGVDKQTVILGTEADWLWQQFSAAGSKDAARITKAFGHFLGEAVAVRMVKVDAASSADSAKMMDDPVLSSALKAGARIIEDTEEESEGEDGG